MNSPTFRHFLLWPLLATLLGSCATSVPLHVPVSQELVWPSPPQAARIGYVRSFSRPEDLGIRKGFFQVLGDFILGADETRLVRPMAITVTKDQVIYVADPGVKGVHQFDLKAGSYRVIRQKDDGLLPSPVAVINGTKQDVYIVDSQLAKVFHYRNGEEYASPVPLHAELKQPTAMVFDATTGNFYIVDTAAHQIKVFDHKGELLKTIGRRGNAPGEFNFPTHIWMNGQRQLFVTDSLNFRIQILDAEGKYIGSFGKHGDGTGNMSRPKGVTTDASGHVYVVDALFNALQIFNQKGDLLLSVGHIGQALGEFWLPTGIFLDDHGDIYIADSHNRRVQVFRYLGKST